MWSNPDKLGLHAPEEPPICRDSTRAASWGALQPDQRRGARGEQPKGNHRSNRGGQHLRRKHPSHHDQRRDADRGQGGQQLGTVAMHSPRQKLAEADGNRTRPSRRLRKLTSLVSVEEMHSTCRFTVGHRCVNFAPDGATTYCLRTGDPHCGQTAVLPHWGVRPYKGWASSCTARARRMGRR